jgi:ElaB/YqjD/DUF883 family membrane-anchored ribosome-binding protein
MSDTDIRMNQPTSAQGLKDKLAGAGDEMKQRAGDALRVSTEVARDKLKEVVDTAKDVATDTAGKVQEQARAQQGAGADYVSRFAGNIRNAAHAFEADTPFAAQGIKLAADYVEDAADKLRTGTFNDVVNSATDFARRQPAAFLGLSVLAGFAAVRFFRASGNAPQQSGDLQDNAS